MVKIPQEKTAESRGIFHLFWLGGVKFIRQTFLDQLRTGLLLGKAIAQNSYSCLPPDSPNALNSWWRSRFALKQHGFALRIEVGWCLLMEPVRVLFVDDEPGICLTLPEILRQHGFSVTAVGTVNEALAEITSAQFDVLISDLNFDHPADGFIVVSAMRRTQPNCVTLILTGYPGFDSALKALRNQVDDYLIKPADIPALVNLIGAKLQQRKPGRSAATKRLA
jgi:CheY-like chemotaxis protein